MSDNETSVSRVLDETQCALGRMVRHAEAEAARAERAEAQLAALRAAWEADETGRIDGALFDPAAAEAHDERMRAEGRDEAMADFTSARVFEAERDALAGQLAALREAARETLIAYGGEGDPLGAALGAALDAGARAAEAHEARIIGACAGCIADDDQQIAPAEYTPVVNAMVKRDRRVRAEALREVAAVVSHSNPTVLGVASDLEPVVTAIDGHHAMVRAEALREAAETCEREAADCSTATGSYIASRCGTLLRARADEIERGA